MEIFERKNLGCSLVLLSKNSSEFGLLYCFYILFKRGAGVG